MAPKKAAATTTPTGGKQYDEVVVIVLLMALKASGSSGNPYYKDMALLDGSRSASGFEHACRAANKIAGELLEKKKQGMKLGPGDIGRDASAGGGGVATPQKGVTGSGGGATPSSASAKKRGREGESSPSVKRKRVKTGIMAAAVDSAYEDDDDEVKLTPIKDEDGDVFI